MKKKSLFLVALIVYCFACQKSHAESILGITNTSTSEFVSMMPELAAVTIPNHGTYVFRDNEYYKYKIVEGELQLLSGYPRELPGGWQNLPPYFHSGIDAAFYYPPKKKTYLFKGKQYVRLSGIKVDKGYPKDLSDADSEWNWYDLPFKEDIDAAIWMDSDENDSKDGYIIFIKGDKFCEYHTRQDGLLVSSLRNRDVSNLWGELPQGFNTATQAMFKVNEKGSYLFNGNRYMFVPGRRAEYDQSNSLIFWIANDSNLKLGVPKNTKELKIGINDAELIKPLTKIAAGASVTIPEQGTYIFFGKKYYKYKIDISGKKTPELLHNYPRDLPGGWQNMPEYFLSGIDAAFYYPPSKKTYMFKGGQYIRLTDFKVDVGYPKKLPGGFQGLPKIFQRDIDAAFVANSPTGKAQVILIKNKDFVVFENWKKIETGKLKNLWKDLPSGFQNEIQAIAYGGFWGNYLFAGDKALFAFGHASHKDPFFSINKGNANFDQPKNVSDWKLEVHNTSSLAIANLCPEGNMCPELFQLLFDVRIRSYIPPRFTHFGSDGKNFNPEIENMESFHQYKNLTKVGCRYSINKVRRAIRDDMDIFEQFADLFNQTRNQWQGIYDDAKGLAASIVADGVCGIVDPTPTCEKNVSSLVEAGINVGLAALGVPPEIPDLEQLREHGIEYLATQGAGYAVGGADQLVGAALSPEVRAATYEAAYQLAKDEFEKQLNKTVPPATYNAEDPATWGKLLPMYAPHNARMYIEIKVKNRKAYELILGENFTAHPTLSLKDNRDVYQNLTEIPFPEYIPEGGLIIPLELRPSLESRRNADGSVCTNCKNGWLIAGEIISPDYLKEKFTIYDLLTQQKNFTGKYSNIHQYGYSDWDMFYKAVRLKKDTEASFKLTGNFSFKDGSNRFPRFKVLETQNIAIVDVWDAITGVGVLKETTPMNTRWEKKKFVLKNYYGRQDPICACDRMVSKPCNPLKGNTIWMSWW